MDGDAMLPPGRVTLQGAKLELNYPDNNAVEVNNYRGELALGPYQFYVFNPLHHFVQQGDAPFAFTLWGSAFYNSRPDFKLGVKPSVLGCYGVGSDKGQAHELPDATLSAALSGVGHALDDLRRLGAVDLKINYTEQK